VSETLNPGDTRLLRQSGKGYAGVCLTFGGTLFDPEHYDAALSPTVSVLGLGFNGDGTLPSQRFMTDGHSERHSRGGGVSHTKSHRRMPFSDQLSVNFDSFGDDVSGIYVGVISPYALPMPAGASLVCELSGYEKPGSPKHSDKPFGTISIPDFDGRTSATGYFQGALVVAFRHYKDGWVAECFGERSPLAVNMMHMFRRSQEHLAAAMIG